MQYQLKSGERILDENALKSVSANERRVSYFSIGTTFEFSSQVQLVGYQSSTGRQLVKLAGILKNGKESTVPMSLLMRVPFQNADALAKTDFQKSLNACADASAVWDLLKGRKITVSEIVTVLEVPYGESTAREVKYSVFDYAR